MVQRYSIILINYTRNLRNNKDNAKESSNSLSLHSPALKYNDNDTLHRLSVGEHRTLQEDGRGMEEPANDIRANDSTNAVLPEGRRKNGARRKGEAEAAKQIAKDRNRWIELDELSKLGRPSVSGDESDNFTNTNRGKVYKRIADDEDYQGIR